MKYAKYECSESCKVLSAPKSTQWITWRLCRCVWCDKKPVPRHSCLRRNVDTSFICGMGAHPLWKQVCNFRPWTSCKYLEYTYIRRTNDYTQVLNSWHYILKIVRFFSPWLNFVMVPSPFKTICRWGLKDCSLQELLPRGSMDEIASGKITCSLQPNLFPLSSTPATPLSALCLWWYLGAWNTSWICSLELLLW